MKTAVDEEVQELAGELEDQTPEWVLAVAFVRFPKLTIALSGIESAVLVDMASKMRADVSVFTLDTGRMHEETHRFLDAMRERYPIQLDVMSPDAARVEAMVREKGLYSFYADGHEECCGIRKVEPMKRMLATRDAWVTGQRRDQSPTRKTIGVVELDTTFGSAERPLVKLNPLAKWDVARVWSYAREHRVPINALYEQGFASIGCAPCTRAVLPGEHERSGRWWWEDAEKKECGIHAGNLVRLGRR
jgi:phosphoadenosine phosphosulfate reductase